MIAEFFVDTAPVMEKYFAKKTQVGWLGKHTNIVSKKFGSWLFLSEIFIPIDLDEDKPSTHNCGSCNDCLKICPTEAIYDNFKIDARKCISYLTIEHKGPIPISLRKRLATKSMVVMIVFLFVHGINFQVLLKIQILSLKKEKSLSFF